MTENKKETFQLPSQKRNTPTTTRTTTPTHPQILINSYNLNAQTVTYTLTPTQKQELNKPYTNPETEQQTNYLLYLIEKQTTNFINHKTNNTIQIDEITYFKRENENTTEYIYKAHYTQ